MQFGKKKTTTDLENISFNPLCNAHENSESCQYGVLLNNVKVIQDT